MVMLRTLSTVVLALQLGVVVGCSKPLDPEEYGEIIKEVPPDLNKPYPLPQLELPQDPAEKGGGDQPGNGPEPATN
jgi:hypothetical protein